MKNLVKIVLVIIMTLTVQMYSQENSHSKIEFRVNFINNYIMHIYCAAGLGEYKSNIEYAEKFRNTIDSQDLIKLKKYESRLAFADGKTGEFTYFCFFLPSYLELNNKKELIQYYSIIINAIEKNNFQEFLNVYKINREDPFISGNLNFYLNIPDSIHKKMIIPLIEEFKIVSRIFIDNINSYEKSVWPIAKKELDTKIKYYTGMIDGENLIRKWEDFTVLNFDKNYQIFLLYANKKGPSANSMSFEKNMFYYNFPVEYFHDFISHEIGTHLIFPLVWKDKKMQEYSWNNSPKVYKATESLCQYYNKLILQKDKLEYNMSDYKADEYEMIFRKYYIKGISHLDLLTKGLEEVN